MNASSFPDRPATGHGADPAGRRPRVPLPRARGLRDGTGLPIDALPVTLKILLENLVRHCDKGVVNARDVLELANWSATCEAGEEVAFHPVRILMPDSSGIPLLADLAAMRDATTRFGGDPAAVNPHVPLDLIVDHTVTIDVSGVPDAAAKNLELEYGRNGERYTFLRWAQNAFKGLSVVPPGNGICHQINLERLAKVVWTFETARRAAGLSGRDHRHGQPHRDHQ